MTVVAEGRVTRAEIEAYLEAVTGAGANDYAKIFDALRGEGAMTRDDMAILAATPLAILLQEQRQAGLEPVLGVLAAADRPLRLFTSRPAAKRWVKRAAVVNCNRRKLLKAGIEARGAS